MKKWSEIKQATLDKLFLDEDEAQQQNYLQKFRYLANECLNIIANGVKPKIATFEITTTDENQIVEFPEDFISYADLVNYLDDEPDPILIYIDWNKIKLKKAGNYKIFYNAIWHEINKDDIKTDAELHIDPSVLNCLPTYMASQLLAQDDVQRSTILKNEFELMLSRLDVNVMNQQNHFKSEGGWY